MKLTMLGTGNALVTECYNTCFVLSEKNQHFLVDGGGGNQILSRLKQAEIDWREIHDIFVTHKHLDHITGIIWLIRVICQSMKQGEYDGEVHIYAPKKVIQLLSELSQMLLKKSQTNCIGKRLHLIPVSDGEERTIIGHKIVFFDIQSTKTLQYGFTMYLDHGQKLTCCGDEPYRDCENRYAKDSKWLLHEAFCLHSQADLFKPHEKHHSTVKEACQAAERLHVKNLVLYHTEDQNIRERKEKYAREGCRYFSGNLHIPDDLETLEL